MSLPAPRLDDRCFQDIVDEAKKRIPHFCKEWTDHNVSDPGVTLIELFAWMTDLILYRLNQVPARHTIKFMDLLGITLREPVPARVPVTFWLSAPQPATVTIPLNTEVATTQTETERPIVFSTEALLQIHPPQLASILSQVNAGSDHPAQYEEQNLRRLEVGLQGVQIFASPPQPDNALYFGFQNDLSHHILQFEIDFDPADAAGIDPTMPPYVWETATGVDRNRWAPCDVEFDTTKGMNGAGQIQIHLPQLARANVKGKELYWVRVRVKAISAQESQEGMRPYRQSPKLRRVAVHAFGGTVPAVHARQVDGEVLGQSDGTPGQRFQLQTTPLLERRPGEQLLVVLEGQDPALWVEVPYFSHASPGEHHYTLDSATGELRLAPALRQPDGTIKRYGDVPPRGARLIFQRYHHGGGQEGNVQAHVLDTLKTAIPFVARVRNRTAARGGLDAETLDAASMRAPALLRSRDRAVTAEDFEFLAAQALPAAIGRVKCLQPLPSEAGRVAPGQLYVLVIPRVPNPEGYLTPEQLEVDTATVAALAGYLDERRMLTTRVEVRSPAYHRVSVQVEVRAAPGASQADVETSIVSHLYRFLNPLVGGPHGTGWPFGRDLFVSDVYQCLQGIPGVQYIRNVTMRQAGRRGEAQGEPEPVIEVLGHGVITSAPHQAQFI